MSDRWLLLRALDYDIAVAEHESRKIKNGSLVMGVHLLTYKVRLYQFQKKMKVEDPDTVRRRYNELATEEYGQKMNHVGTEQEKFYDYKPNEFANGETHVYEIQSCYTLNSLADAAKIAADVKAAYFEKKYGKAQQQIFA